MSADDTGDQVLSPTEFTAATRNVWAVPFARPVTVAEVLELVPSANVVQVEPSDEYWTR